MKRLAVLAAVIGLFTVAAAYGGSKNTGTVTVADPSMAVELVLSEKDKVVVNGKGISVPEGTYVLQSYSVMKKGADGKVWKLESGKQTFKLPTLVVEKGQTLSLDYGPPLTIQPIVFQAGTDSKGKRVIPIGYEIKGKQGERYAGAIYVGARKVPAPYFQILDESKKVLAEGEFEYG